jgi:hypothetical protein
VSTGAVAESRQRSDGFALCSVDRFWFRPAYTDGKCPLCGAFAAGGTPELSAWARIDRISLGLGVLALALVAMLIVVLVAYTQG